MQRCLVISVVLSLVGGIAFAYWSAGSDPGGNGASASTGVNAATTPGVSVTATTVTVTWATVTLANGGAVEGYTVRRYNSSLVSQVLSSGCSGTVTTLTCAETQVPDGSWTYTVTPRIGTNWVGTESPRSTPVIVDGTAPSSVIALSGVVGGAYKGGATVYYRGVAAGSFALSNTVVDLVAGAQSSATAVLANDAETPLWTHTASEVSSPVGGPFVSARFGWGAGTTNSPTETVTARDKSGNTATTTLAFADDSSAPTGRTVSYPNGYQAGKSVTITLSGADSDAGSGVATRVLQRSFAPLTNGVCGAYRNYVGVGTDNPPASYTDTALQNGGCYKYRYVVTDNVGNQIVTASGANVAMLDYAAAVSATGGLVGQWRLGEATLSLDRFTGATGTTLAYRSGDINALWSSPNGAATAFLTAQGTIRRSNTAGTAGYTTSSSTGIQDYLVEADVVVKSIVAGDSIALQARSDFGGAGNYYLARYTGSAWQLVKKLGGTETTLGSFAQTLTAGATYRLGLDMNGSTIRLLIDGAPVVQVTDSAVSGFFYGVRLGSATSPAISNAAQGLELDNFRVTPRLRDSHGANHGLYLNGPTLGAPGVVLADTNSAASFDGLNDFGTVARQIANDFSIEFWFASTQGIGTGVNWYDGAGLVDAEVSGLSNDFGVSLRSDGRIVGGVGRGAGVSDVSVVSSAGGYNNGLWHQVVFTRKMATGALQLYVDGVPVGSATGGTQALSSALSMDFGRSLAGGKYFVGSLDEIAVYNGPLTAASIGNHYQLGASAGADSVGPSGGSIDALGLAGTASRYSTGTTLSLGFSPGTDASGIAPTGNQIWRASAPLTSTSGANGACGTFTAPVLIDGGSDPVSPKVDTIADQACYRYEYRVIDTNGNAAVYTSAQVKIDTTAPATPALAVSAPTNAYWSAGASTLYYRANAGSGTFRLTATATDAASGVAAYSLPVLGTGWTSTPGTIGMNIYSWTGTPNVPGPRIITATNNAGTVSAAAPITVTPDNAPPTDGTITYRDGATANTTISIAFTTGTDNGSGLGTRLLQRATATLTGSSCGTFGAFVTVPGGTNPTSPTANTVAAGSCYRFQYTVADNLGQSVTASSAGIVRASTYASTVTGTPSLVNYWRLSETTISADSFAGAPGALLTARTGEIGASWTRWASDTITGVLTGEGRLRRASNATGAVAYRSSGVPAGADYLVEADVHVKSVINGDSIGIQARVDPAASGAGTYYLARYDEMLGGWHVIKVMNGTATSLRTYAQVLTAGSTYRLGLEVNGSTVRLFVDGVERVSVTDTQPITAAGRAGVRLGSGNSGAVTSDEQGLQLDNFRVAPAYALDSKGTNHGLYANGPTLGDAGAIIADPTNKAALFDGVSESVAVARQIADDFSIEFWFKSTQGGGTGDEWWQNVGLIDAEMPGFVDDFGVALRADGRIMAGIGGGEGGADTSIGSSATGYNNNVWHHVVFTRASATGNLQLYVDGAVAASGIGSTRSLTSATTITFGRSPLGTNHYAGSLDEVSVYSAVLTAPEVTARYDAGN